MKTVSNTYGWRITTYFNDVTGIIHRTDGPAKEIIDVMTQEIISLSWFDNGLRHRIDGPAEILHNGREIWYTYGKLHRNDGPAVVNKLMPIPKDESYWINGVNYTENDWLCKKMNSMDIVTV